MADTTTTAPGAEQGQTQQGQTQQEQQTAGTQGKAETGAAGTEKTFTQAELDAIIGKRLAKLQAESEQKIQAAVTEAQKLARMSADEKARHEAEKREADLKAREAEITRRELKAAAVETLTGKGLPKDLADILPLSDAESLNDAIGKVEAAFRAAVQAGVEERLKGKDAPKAGGAAAAGDPAKMSYGELAALYQRDPAAYKKLIGG